MWALQAQFLRLQRKEAQDSRLVHGQIGSILSQIRPR